MKSREASCLAQRAMLLAGCVLLASCGGSGPSTSLPPPPPAPTPTPAPAPTPTPTPAPTPTPTPTPTTFPQAAVPATFNTAEFRDSDGPRQHNAHVAWAAGRTGAGVTIAVIDTGIDSDSPEFAGRLSASSVDLYPARGTLDGSDDHGTLVAMVAAAARNGTGVLGMAWSADLLAIRADEPGSCAADNSTSAEDCAFLDDYIARGVDHAVANGARVINISLGGEGGANATLQQAVRNAAAAGAIVVVAAGNDGAAGLDDFGRQMIAAGNGAVVMVGAVDAAYQIADFSNRAGSDGQFYLTALGDAICCVYEDGELFIDDEGFAFVVSGTSFAAPQVAGAAALLAQAFPNLTGRQIADILLRSAFDAGASGTDTVFGRGVLDVDAAFRPIGATSLAGGSGAFSTGEASGTLSPAMGDALASAGLATSGLTTVILDEYARAFETTLAGSFRSARQRSPLHGALAGQHRQLGGSNGQASVAFTIDAGGRPDALRLTAGEAEQARVLAARVTMQLSPHTQVGFAYAQGADGLVAQLQGQDRPAFMIAGSPAGDAGLVERSDAAFAVRRRLGDWGFTVSAASGEAWSAAADRQLAAARGQVRREGVTEAGVAIDRSFGGVDAALGLSWLGEEASLLGAFFQPGLGLAGADSMFLDASARWRPAERWQVGASFRQGRTTAHQSTVVAAGSRLSSRGFAFDVARSGVFSASDALAIRVSQPLRVESGSLGLALPTGWDYATLSAERGLQWLALAPSGRELATELAWRGPLWGGQAATSVYWRRDPGHIADMPDDVGLAWRWSGRF